MFVMGLNSRVVPEGHGAPGSDGVAAAAAPLASTQAGLSSRATRSGMACASTTCLSAIDGELSIMNRRSILSTDLLINVSKRMVDVPELPPSLALLAPPVLPGSPDCVLRISVPPQPTRTSINPTKLDHPCFTMRN